MEYSAQQLKAIDFISNLQKRVVAITGPAGSGKTTLMQEGIKILRSKGRNPAVAAPTGRAARRVKEATGYEAVTLHKLLGYGKPDVDPDTGLPKETTSPSYNKEKRLPFSDILVDEYMMVNEELHRNLHDALPAGGRLIAFGDRSQLPPIEPYEVKTLDGEEYLAPFERILKLPSSVTLDVVFRQGEDSGILINADRIRNGKPPVNNDDFSIKVSEVPIHHLVEHIRAAYDAGVDFSTLEHQVITPARKGKLGTHALNSALQALFRKEGQALDLPRDKWDSQHEVRVRLGEKVICNENIYDLRDFFDRFTEWEDGHTPIWQSYVTCPEAFTMLNGEIGIITDILPNGTLFIAVSDRTVQMPASYRDYIPKYGRVYERDPRRKLDLAYAITTHKMQGSECETVAFVMHKTLTFMLNRNNIYTAVTRAKKRVHLITDQQSLLNGMRYTAHDKIKAMSVQRKGFKIEKEPT